MKPILGMTALVLSAVANSVEGSVRAALQSSSLVATPNWEDVAFVQDADEVTASAHDDGIPELLVDLPSSNKTLECVTNVFEKLNTTAQEMENDILETTSAFLHTLVLLRDGAGKNMANQKLQNWMENMWKSSNRSVTMVIGQLDSATVNINTRLEVLGQETSKAHSRVVQALTHAAEAVDATDNKKNAAIQMVLLSTAKLSKRMREAGCLTHTAMQAAMGSMRGGRRQHTNRENSTSDFHKCMTAKTLQTPTSDPGRLRGTDATIHVLDMNRAGHSEKPNAPDMKYLKDRASPIRDKFMHLERTLTRKQTPCEKAAVAVKRATAAVASFSGSVHAANDESIELFGDLEDTVLSGLNMINALGQLTLTAAGTTPLSIHGPIDNGLKKLLETRNKFQNTLKDARTSMQSQITSGNGPLKKLVALADNFRKTAASRC